MTTHEIVKIGPYDCTITSAGGIWRGKMEIPMLNGEVITLHAKEDEKEIAKSFGIPPKGAAAGGWWSKIKRFAKKKILRKITGGLKKVLNNPLVRKAMSVVKFVPGFGTAINSAYTMARKVTNIADGLARGNPRTRRAVRRIRHMAQTSTDPRMRRQAQGVVNQLRNTYSMRYGLRPNRSRRYGRTPRYARYGRPLRYGQQGGYGRASGEEDLGLLLDAAASGAAPIEGNDDLDMLLAAASGAVSDAAPIGDGDVENLANLVLSEAVKADAGGEEIGEGRGWDRKDLGPISGVGAEHGFRDLWGAIKIGVEDAPSKARADYIEGQKLLAAASGY